MLHFNTPSQFDMGTLLWAASRQKVTSSEPENPNLTLLNWMQSEKVESSTHFNVHEASTRPWPSHLLCCVFKFLQVVIKLVCMVQRHFLHTRSPYNIFFLSVFIVSTCSNRIHMGVFIPGPQQKLLDSIASLALLRPSRTIDHWQVSLLLTIGHSQPLILNHYQPLRTILNCYQPLWSAINQHQSLWTIMSETIMSDEPSWSTVNHHQP